MIQTPKSKLFLPTLPVYFQRRAFRALSYGYEAHLHKSIAVLVA